ncbi:MAG: hypothetical protein ACYDCK_12650 [Thermoplasmatota archaeon]
MKRFALVAIVALALAAPAFAGCLEKARAAFGLSDGELSAKEIQPRADTYAKKWDKDALLVVVTTFEAKSFPNPGNMSGMNMGGAGAHPSAALLDATLPWRAAALARASSNSSASTNASKNESSGNPGRSFMVADPTPADGRAPVWLFGYLGSDGKQGLAFVIAANGSIVWHATEDVRSDKTRTDEVITDWHADSTDAFDAARANATFAKASSATNASSYEVLAQDKHATEWIVSVFGPGIEPVDAIVNASTGRLEHVSTYNFSFSMPSFECCGSYGGYGGYGMFGGGQNYGNVTYSKQYSGQLTVASPTAQHPFVVASRGETLRLHLQYQRLAEIEHVTVHAIGAGGREIQCSVKNTGGGVGSGEITEDYTCAGAQSGDGIIRLDLDNPGVQADYQLRVLVTTR